MLRQLLEVSIVFRRHGNVYSLCISRCIAVTAIPDTRPKVRDCYFV